MLAVTSLAGGVFFLDQGTKHLFQNHPAAQLIPGIIETTQHQNHGLLANLPVPLPLILVVTTGICLGLLWAFCKKKQPAWGYTLAIACILGGALGNLYDRFTNGFVFDWILLFSRSIINVADIGIGIGILLWLIHEYRHGLDQSKKSRQL